MNTQNTPNLFNSRYESHLRARYRRPLIESLAFCTGFTPPLPLLYEIYVLEVDTPALLSLKELGMTLFPDEDAPIEEAPPESYPSALGLDSPWFTLFFRCNEDSGIFYAPGDHEAWHHVATLLLTAQEFGIDLRRRHE